jgi:hypothetical protein
MYAVGNLPDHVTRYNHKNTNRWLVQTAQPRDGHALWVTLYGFAMALAVGSLIVTAVLMMQGVA